MQRNWKWLDAIENCSALSQIEVDVTSPLDKLLRDRVSVGGKREGGARPEDIDTILNPLSKERYSTVLHH